MEFLTVNVTGKARREKLHGRSHIVVPARMIVGNSVMPGSKGPLFYDARDVGRDPMAWNGMPIVVDHPVVDGQHVSARDPQVIEEFGIGNVYRTSFAGNLDAEAWFDEELTKAADEKLKANGRPRILPRLKAGKPIELSTGLFTDDVPVRNGKCPTTGKAYTHRATNHRPDHLAVLPDKVGACSVKDGCGIGVNAKADQDEIHAGEGMEGGQGRMSRQLAELTGATPFTSEALDDGMHHHFYSDDPGAAAKAAYDYFVQQGLEPEISDEKGLWSVEVMMGDQEHMLHFLPSKAVTANAVRKLPNGKWRLYSRKGSNENDCGINVNEGGPDPKALLAVSKWLAKNGAMPGYGQVFVKGGEVWYVGGDGDEWPEKNLPVKKFGEVPGVTKVTYEAESFPKKEQGWQKVTANGLADQDEIHAGEDCDCGGECEECKAKQTANGFCPTGEGGGIDNSCGSSGVFARCDRDEGGRCLPEGDALEAIAKGRTEIPYQEFGIGSSKGSPFELIGPDMEIDFSKGQQMSVPLSKLRSYGDVETLHVPGIRKHATSNAPIDVFFYRGKFWVVDGHHRVAAKVVNGDKTIRARVLSIEEIGNEIVINAATANANDGGGESVQSSGKIGEKGNALDDRYQAAGKAIESLKPGRVVKIEGLKVKKHKLGYVSVDGGDPKPLSIVMRQIAKAIDPTNNAGAHGNPQSKNTGRFKGMNAGFGKGEVHERVQAGFMQMDDDDRRLGKLALEELLATGSNPASWVEDEDVWEKAKTAAGKTYGEDDEAYWAAVTHIYKKMGGGIKAAAPTENEESDMADKLTRDQKIKKLTTNCACWKGKDKLLANAELFSDKDIDGLLADQDEKALVVNAVREQFELGDDVTINALPDEMKKKMMGGEEEEETAEGETKPACNEKDKKPLTANEWKRQAPPEIRTLLDHAEKRFEQDLQAKVTELVANVADPTERQARGVKLYRRAKKEPNPMAWLEEMQALIPTSNAKAKNSDDEPTPDFSGMGGPNLGIFGGGRQRPGELTRNEDMDLDLESQPWRQGPTSSNGKKQAVA